MKKVVNDRIKQAEDILKPLYPLIEDKELYHRVLVDLTVALGTVYYEGRSDELSKIEEIYGFRKPKSISDN